MGLDGCGSGLMTVPLLMGVPLLDTLLMGVPLLATLLMGVPLLATLLLVVSTSCHWSPAPSLSLVIDVFTRRIFPSYST